MIDVEERPPPLEPGRRYFVRSVFVIKGRGPVVTFRDPCTSEIAITAADVGIAIVRMSDGLTAKVKGIERYRNLRGTIGGGVLLDVELNVDDEVEFVRDEEQ